jgi:recombinational DNA repair ATPase RecF
LVGDYGRSILTAGQRLDNIMATATTTAPPPRAPTAPGAYFLSLTVENVRCFGPAQTLDLSDGHGRHAPWTVIVGENNLGKTTLLTCLAVVPRTGYPGEQEPDHQIRLLWEGIDLGPLFRGSGDVQARFEVGMVFSDRTQRNGKVQVKIRNSSDLHSSPQVIGSRS